MWCSMASRPPGLCKMTVRFGSVGLADTVLVLIQTDFAQLHCTVVNTVYRRPRSNNRIPFDYNAVKNSSALATILQREDDDGRGITSGQSIVTRSTTGNYGRMQVVAADGRAQLTAAGAQATAGESRGPASPALQIDLGRWTVTEVQLCEMGSHASDGAYVCVGSVPLLTPSVAPVART